MTTQAFMNGPQIANIVWQQATPYVVAIILSLVSLVFGWIRVQEHRLIKNPTIQGILDRATDAAEKAVLFVEQTFVADLTKNGLPLSAADRATAKARAIAEFTSHMSALGFLDEFKKIVGPANLADMLNRLIESEVAKLGPSTQPITVSA